MTWKENCRTNGKNIEFFEKESRFWKNQQVIAMRELFRGFVVKEWASSPNETTYFSKNSKILVVKCVSSWDECWKQCCATLCDQSLQKITLQKHTKITQIEARSGEIVNLNNYLMTQPTQEDSESVKNMVG